MNLPVSIPRIAVAACLVASATLARPAREALMFEPIALDSGAFDGKGETTYVAYQELIELVDAPWIQLHFGDCRLGEASYVTLTVVATGEVQPLDASGMELWRHLSAPLRGDAVELALHVAPGDRGVYVTATGITAPDISRWGDRSDGGVATICGDFDNRGASNDSRVGRINGCTAWLVSTGVALTAGHCTDDDGRLAGNMLFNVPLSDPNGSPNTASLADTYPIINNSWTWEENGTGDDWLILRIGPAADGSGNRAHVEQGFFHMTTMVPPEDATMRVTGYGLDNIPPGTGGSGADCCDWDDDDECNNDCNATSRTLQTATGRFDQLSFDDTLEYEVDTMPANSGSPVIWVSNGLAVGIHTAGGCGSAVDGDENHGTWFGDGPLSSALNSYLGGNTIFVDSVNVSTLELGQALFPFESVAAAASVVPSGWTVLIAAGNYPASAGNTFTTTRPMTLMSNTGLVTIGN
jgi:V8-like Glu-specific endopeptidase